MVDPADHLLPKDESSLASSALGKPSQKAQSLGVVISIIVIVAMIVTGAFYAWGKRIAEQKALYDSVQSTPTESF